MPFLGRPLIKHVIDRLVRLVPDLRPGRGALGGLHTALASASHPLVAVVACDMPFASLEIFQYACQVIEESGADVAIPTTGDGLEPLHAIYRKQTCLPLVEVAMDADQWKLISWFDQAKVKILNPDEITRLDPSGLAFWNLNTPEEFKLAEEKTNKR